MKAMKIVIVALAALVLGSGVVLAGPKKKQNTLVDVALAANAATGEFGVLIAALGAADPSVIKTLSARGQRTVFAPTDAAFVSLLDELGVSATELLSDSALVTQVLLYHVVQGRRDASIILSSDRLRTLQGGFLRQRGGVLTDRNGRTANIITTNIPADNGLIHVIDRVVLP